MQRLSRGQRRLRGTWAWLVSVCRSLYFTPAVVCAAILAVTVLIWQAAEQSLKRDITVAINDRVDGLTTLLAQRLTSYEQMLRGTSSLFSTANHVGKDEWEGYMNALGVEKNYPDTQDIGYAALVTAGDVPAFLASAGRQGISNISVPQIEPGRGSYALTFYGRPVAMRGMPTAGLDIYAESQRREAAERARNAGEVTITKKVELFSTDTSTPRTGFIMYAPHYAAGMKLTTPEERHAALRGYVFAVFRSSVFFPRLASEHNVDPMGYRIVVEGDSLGAPLYQSPNYVALANSRQMFHESRPFDIFGVRWNIDYVIDPMQLVGAGQLTQPMNVVVAGLTTAMFAATVVLLVLRGRARELHTERERALELAKDELLSLASHQLRTPATGVKQYLGMVLQGFSGRVAPQQRVLLERAYASNDRQLRVINEILHLAKIDSGRIVLALQPVNLNDLIVDVVNEQQVDIDAAQHRTKLTLPRRPVVINADIHTLRMAVENVLSNAIKYTSPGGKISIRLRKTRGVVYIDVSDTGVGIGKDDIPRVFQQFVRLPNTMTQDIGGTGIGLYLAKHLVRLHGGHISVVSTPGRGSTFTISLPRKEQHL